MRGKIKLKEEVNDDKEKVLNLEGVRTTLDKDIKFLDHKENLNNNLVANEKMKENVSKQVLGNTYTKSSNVIDCKADILKNVTNNDDNESFKQGDGHKYKLFIYNLPTPNLLTEDKVESIFAKYGVVTGCERILSNPNRKWNGTRKKIFHVTFEDENVSIKLKSIGKIIVDGQKIVKVRNTLEVSMILAEFVERQVLKKEIRNTFSKFGALQNCKGGRNGSNKNESGFFLAFEDERVNKMLIEKGSVDYHGHKIFIKEVFYI